MVELHLIPVVIIDNPIEKPNEQREILEICGGCDKAIIKEEGTIVDLGEYKREEHHFLGPILYTFVTETTPQDIAA